MQRRNFIIRSTMLAFSVSAFGGIQWNGSNFEGDSPTTTDILGPFYRPGAPKRNNLIPPGSKGTPLNLQGVVYNENKDKVIKNALVEIWHCDENQYYDNATDDYLCRGALNTNSKGQYNFKTIIPVPYKASPNDESSWRPAHIHMRVSVPGQQDLITQIYFKGHKYIDSDTWASRPEAVNRVLEITQNEKGHQQVVFDIILKKEIPLSEESYDKITGLYKMEDKNNMEFIKKDDMLFLKRNGQLAEGLSYIGSNTFEGGIGNLKVTFELLEKGKTKVVVHFYSKTIHGEKFLKYS